MSWYFLGEDYRSAEILYGKRAAQCTALGFAEINAQYTSEFLTALQSAIGQMSVDGVRISSLPAKSMELAIDLPYGGSICGMGIPEGVTLIIGGGYHGKSTLLQALEQGVYNHVKGDGREYVITRDDALKLRAEDGRAVSNLDLSLFIHDLPNGKDTVKFNTENASGSTSQAANIIEAIESKSKVLLNRMKYNISY